MPQNYRIEEVHSEARTSATQGGVGNPYVLRTE
jgi:hypothetical protein